MPAGVLNRRVLESLAAAGALDSLGGTRERLFAGAAGALEHAAAQHRDAAAGQSSLFGEDSGSLGVAVAPPLPEVPAWTDRERGTREKELIGFYLSGHPLEPIRAQAAKIATHSIGEVLEQGDGAEVRIVALVGEIKSITTKTGKLMGMVTLEDLSGRIECTLFPEAWEQSRSKLEADAVVVASGRIEVREERGPKLLINDVRPWETAQYQFTPALYIEVRAEDLSEDNLAGMDEVLSAHPGDADVLLNIVKPDNTRLAMRSRRFRVSDDPALVAGLKSRMPSARVRWGKGGV
jgi:DNA polymerase-3 subunit alpha